MAITVEVKMTIEGMGSIETEKEIPKIPKDSEVQTWRNPWFKWRLTWED